MYNANYNFHGLISIRVSTEDKNVLSWYDHLFRQFRSESTEASQYYTVLDYSSFELPADYRYAGPDVLVFDSGYCFPNERHAVVMEGNRVTEYSGTGYRPTYFWFQYLLLRENLCVIHAAGFGLGGRGIIFPAYSGGGKTLLFSYFRRRRDFLFFSEEFVILDPEGRMLSCPSDFSLHRIHLRLMPELRTPDRMRFFSRRKRILDILSRVEKIPVPRVLSRIRQFGIFVLRREQKIPVFVPVTEAIAPDAIGDTLPVDTAILLTRYSGSEIRFREMGKDLFVEQICRIFDLEFRDNHTFLRVLPVSEALSPVSYEKKIREILSASLAGVTTVEVLVPHRMEPEAFSGAVMEYLETRR